MLTPRIQGLSFSDNMKKMRMNHAAELLEKTNLTVQKIAEMNGYYDAASFRHLFKKFYNRTPQQYRDEKRTGAD